MASHVHRFNVGGVAGKKCKDFFWIKQGIQRIFGILFVSQLLFGLFVLRFLRGFPLTCYNLIGQQCVIPMGWSNQSVCLFFLIFDSLQFCFSLVGGFLILLLYFIFINIFLCGFLSKKKKRLQRRKHCFIEGKIQQSSSSTQIQMQGVKIKGWERLFLHQGPSVLNVERHATTVIMSYKESLS